MTAHDVLTTDPNFSEVAEPLTTDEMLLAVSNYVDREWAPGHGRSVINCVHNIDNSLCEGWDDEPFLSSYNLVFLFLLLKHSVPVTAWENQFLACLYLAYCYMGCAISYPLRPFLPENESRDRFVARVLDIANACSDTMLASNLRPAVLRDALAELCSFAVGDSPSASAVPSAIDLLADQLRVISLGDEPAQ